MYLSWWAQGLYPHHLSHHSQQWLLYLIHKIQHVRVIFTTCTCTWTWSTTTILHVLPHSWKLNLDPTLHTHLQWASVKRLIQTQMTIVYLSLFCLLINNNSTVVPNALSQVTHTRSGEKLKKKCFSGKTGDKPRASLRSQLNDRVTHTCKLFHYNKMCSRTFKTVINNNIKK